MVVERSVTVIWQSASIIAINLSVTTQAHLRRQFLENRKALVTPERVTSAFHCDQ